MNGIQGFYIGGSADNRLKAASSMPRTSFSQNQKVRDLGQKFRERRDKGNQNSQQQIMRDMRENDVLGILLAAIRYLQSSGRSSADILLSFELVSRNVVFKETYVTLELKQLVIYV